MDSHSNNAKVSVASLIKRTKEKNDRTQREAEEAFRSSATEMYENFKFRLKQKLDDPESILPITIYLIKIPLPLQPAYYRYHPELCRVLFEKVLAELVDDPSKLYLEIELLTVLNCNVVVRDRPIIE